MVFRLLVLKHLRNWSYATLEQEVRTIGGPRVYARRWRQSPRCQNHGRWASPWPQTVVERLHQRLVAIARGSRSWGPQMRVDTTVVETNIHYPTDSSLLGDGVRVLTRTMKQVTVIAGTVGATLRDRSRSVKRRVWRLVGSRAARARSVRRN